MGQDLPRAQRLSHPETYCKKKKRCGTRGGSLKTILSNTRLKVPDTFQKTKTDYHNRTYQKFSKAQQLTKKELLCSVCDCQVSGKSALQKHFRSKNAQKGLFRCTSKYCKPCGIIGSFKTEQLYKDHLSSRVHRNKVGTRQPGPNGPI